MPAERDNLFSIVHGPVLPLLCLFRACNFPPSEYTSRLRALLEILAFSNSYNLQLAVYFN